MSSAFFFHLFVFLSSLSPLTASLFITNGRFGHYQVSIGLVYSIHDPTELAIQKMIDASQRMITVNRQVEGEAREEGWGINPVMKRHLELEIKTLQNAPRDAHKLMRLLEVKQRQKEQAMHIEDTQRLVTEIEMLKVVSYLVSRKSR
jgi:methyl coenzyme M reductase beta subunit